jgi:uncharacterized membrane protein
MKLSTQVLVMALMTGWLTAAHGQTEGYQFRTVDGPAPNDGGTRLAGINNLGVVAGVTYDADFNEQGFVGTPSGPFMTFVVLNAGSMFFPYQGIVAGINDDNVILGFAPKNPRSRSPALIFEFFDGDEFLFVAPWSTPGGTARSINNSDVIAGSFSTGPVKVSGYTLDARNNLTVFNATPTTSWTNAVGINNHGTVVGNYLVPGVPGTVNSGYLRDNTGKISLLPTPKSIGGIIVAPGQIFYNGLNDSGVTVGSFADPNNNAFGFVRDATGKFTLIQFPAGSTTSGVLGINNNGTIIGSFEDKSGVEHGFVGTP